MTSSNTFKKFISIGAAALLAIGGSATPALATGALSLTANPTMTPSTGVNTSTSLSSNTYGVWANAPIGTGGGADYYRICDADPSLLSSVDGTDVPSSLNCHTVYTSFSSPNEFTGTGLSISSVTALDSASNTVTTGSLVGKYVARFSVVKLFSSPNTIYGWAFSSAALIGNPPPAYVAGPAPTLSGTESVGSTLTVSTLGSWSGSPTAYRYQWTTATLTAGTCGFTTSDISGATSSTYVVTSNDAGKCIAAKVWASNAYGEASFPQAATTAKQIPGSSQVGGGGSGLTNCVGHSSLTNVSSSVSSMLRTGTYAVVYNNDASLNNCMINVNGWTSARYVNGTLLGTMTYAPVISLIASTAARNFTSTETTLGRQLVAGDVITTKVWVGLSGLPTTENPTFTYSITIVDSVSNNNSNSGPAPSTPEPVAPVWQAPLLNSVVTVGKNLATAGGKLNLKDGDFSGLKTVTVAGLAVLFTVDSKGSVNIPVPAGKVGTADLTLTFDSGTITIQGGIKYVAPVDVATVPVREISVAAGSSKVTEAVADQIRMAAFANMSNNAVQCVAYATNGSAAAKAAAKATATQVCGLANKANPSLQVTEVTVVVNKAKARKAGVGIKVYKQN